MKYNFNSPGKIVLSIFSGRFWKEVSSMIKYYIPNNSQRLQNENLSIKNKREQVRLIGDYRKELRALGFSDEDVRHLILHENFLINNLENLLNKGKVDGGNLLQE